MSTYFIGHNKFGPSGGCGDCRGDQSWAAISQPFKRWPELVCLGLVATCFGATGMLCGNTAGLMFLVQTVRHIASKNS